MIRAWSSFALPAGRIPGVTSLNAGPSAARSVGASTAEQTTPSSPARCGGACEAQRVPCRGVVDAAVGEVGVGKAGQHRHRDQQRRRAAPGASRVVDGCAGGAHHCRTPRRVHVDHPDAEPRRRRASLRDRVRNVVELEIEEDAKAALDHPAHRLRPGDDEHLLADLQRAMRRIEAIGERQRVHRVREVERDDDFGIRRGHPGSPCAAASRSPTCRSRGSASSTAGRESRSCRTCTCRAA